MSNLTEELRETAAGCDCINEHGLRDMCIAAKDRIEALEGVLADIMQYDLRGRIPAKIIERAEKLEVVI